MSNLILPKRFQQQPQNPVEIDWAHPLSRGLVFAYNGATDSALTQTAGVASRGSEWLGDGLNAIRSVRGRKHPSSLTANRYATFDLLAGVNLSQLSALWVGAVSTTTQTNWTDILSVGNSTQHVVMEIPNSGTFLSKLGVFSVGGTALGAYNSNTSRDSKIHTLALTVSSSANKSVIYFDGIPDNTNTGNWPSFDYTGTKCTLANRVTPSSLRSANCDVHGFALVYGRTLTDTEVRELSANPYQILRPYRSITYSISAVDGSATGATVTVTASLTDGAATSDSAATGATITATASLTAGTAAGTATIARPNADTASGDWTPSTGATLYGCIDEMTYDDADYISTTTTAAATLALSAATDPAASTGHVIRFRAKSPFGNTLTVTLKQGGTAIKTETTAALTGSFADYSIALSGAEADSITDYSALTITLEAA